jgi:iron complex transport system substrate-binding protein
MQPRLPVLALLVVVAATACGGEGGSTSTAPAVVTPGLPVTYTGLDGVTTTVTDASRIVTLSGDFSEIVWDLGLGPNLVGVDLGSVYPKEEMRLKPKVGVEYRLLTEPILALEPTVVIGDIDATPGTVIDQVRAAGVPVVIFPRFEGTGAPAEKIRAVAGVLGLADLGEHLPPPPRRDRRRTGGRLVGAVTSPGGGHHRYREHDADATEHRVRRAAGGGGASDVGRRRVPTGSSR